ncbi:hypothetical protein WH47_05256 [Habropoda laboriosa]|uniref:Uncharacterized protein n=1 Tax=Habropoda laboriosa TaxID=597456 RepID=A0A0L7QVN4_9HYME|nr:hypothetical protein WH47_05256 [Habropoda laboriosa]
MLPIFRVVTQRLTFDGGRGGGGGAFVLEEFTITNRTVGLSRNRPKDLAGAAFDRFSDLSSSHLFGTMIGVKWIIDGGWS